MKNATLRTVEPILVTHRTRTNVLVLYSEAERGFVPLLEALLGIHGHCCSSAIASPPGDPTEREKARTALEEAGALVVVSAGHSVLSPWAHAEVLAFRAANPEAPVVAALLSGPGPEWLASVATRPVIDFAPCLLTGFRELFETLGSRFLAREDLAEPAPVSGEPRARQASEIRRRLQTGLLLGYCREAERSVFEKVTVSPGEMAALETALSKEVLRYEYADLADGRPVSPLQALERASRRVALEVGEGNELEIVRAIRAIADQLLSLHTVQRSDRRRAERRKR